MHPKDIRFAVPTARLVNDLSKPQQYTSLHPKDSRFAVPTARLVNDLLEPQQHTSIHPKDSRFAVPTARLVNDLLEPHQNTSLHPKANRFVVLSLIPPDLPFVPTGNRFETPWKMKNEVQQQESCIAFMLHVSVALISLALQKLNLTL